MRADRLIASVGVSLEKVCRYHDVSSREFKPKTCISRHARPVRMRARFTADKRRGIVFSSEKTAFSPGVE